MKERAIKAFSIHKGAEFIKRNRSYFWSADKHFSRVLYGVEAL